MLQRAEQTRIGAITARQQPGLLGAIATLLLVSTVGLQAQEVDITGTLRFSSERTATHYDLEYGVGSIYTDTTDRDYETFVPPFTPPDGFLMALQRECTVTDGDPPCFFLQDFRGVPDSVSGPEANDQFALTYKINVNTPTGTGFRMRINNGDWPLGVDSIHLVELHIAPSIDTVLTGPLVFATNQDDISALEFTVYYNLRTLSVHAATSVGVQESLGGLENPVNGGIQTLDRWIAPGDRLVCVDMAGRIVLQSNAVAGAITVDFDRLVSGSYRILLLDSDGTPRESRSLVLRR